LNNCAFVSTKNLKKDLTRPFVFLMDASMLGVGVGFDVRGANTIIVHEPLGEKILYKIPDKREGWVESLKLLLESYFLEGSSEVEFDYSGIREKGLPIKGFGGVTSGPEPLKKMHEHLRDILNKNIGQKITIRTITDIFNRIGECVVSGNIRRTAEIAFGPKDSQEYLDLKNYEKNPERAEYGWTSNNSIFADLGMDYKEVCKRIVDNGEPGICWLDNMREYSRMCDPKNNKDRRVEGGNPCLEQSLESYELCCLVETFPANHSSLEEYLRTLKFAYLYAKTVTLGSTLWPETNRVMLRNRRIGCSMSGIAQFITKRSIGEFKLWCDKGYNIIQEWDEVYSDWLVVPRSIKTTSIKPSGTVSLLAGSTPGIHFPISRCYIRRIQLAANSELIEPLKTAGYNIEVVDNRPNTVVVEFPVKINEKIRIVEEVSMWEQISLAAFLQKHWADNQVSCTVTFDPKNEGDQIEHALNIFQYDLKGISFLPATEKGAYKYMPYETISEERCDKMLSKLGDIDFSIVKLDKSAIPDQQLDLFCDGETCSIIPNSDNKQKSIKVDTNEIHIVF